MKKKTKVLIITSVLTPLVFVAVIGINSIFIGLIAYFGFMEALSLTIAFGLSLCVFFMLWKLIKEKLNEKT